MTKKFVFSFLSIIIGSAMVCASFALGADLTPAEANYTPTETARPTAILAPSVVISETETTTAPEEPEYEWAEAAATAYCPCEKCCGQWALNRPDGIVYTASGAEAQEGVTIAADWSIYPPGTVLYIEGIGERTVQDRGGAIDGQKIDVYFESHDDAVQFGRQAVRIRIAKEVTE